MAQSKQERRARGSDATRNPAGAVLGTVITGSLIAIESHQDAGLGQLTATVLGGMLVYWCAHIYAEIIGEHVLGGERLTWKQVGELVRQEYPMMGASFGPLAVILITSAFGFSYDAAVTAGLWSVVVIMGGWALFAGRRSRLRGIELVVYAAMGTLFGVFVVLLKILVH